MAVEGNAKKEVIFIFKPVFIGRLFYFKEEG